MNRVSIDPFEMKTCQKDQCAIGGCCKNKDKFTTLPIFGADVAIIKEKIAEVQKKTGHQMQMTTRNIAGANLSFVKGCFKDKCLLEEARPEGCKEFPINWTFLLYDYQLPVLTLENKFCPVAKDLLTQDADFIHNTVEQIKKKLETVGLRLIFEKEFWQYCEKLAKNKDTKNGSSDYQAYLKFLSLQAHASYEQYAIKAMLFS